MIGESLIEYAPQVYSGFAEYKNLIAAEDKLVADVEKAAAALHDDQFILLATEEGIRYYESMLKIIPNPETETIEFRRQRVLNRTAFATSFTINSLRGRLDAILGEGQYNVYVDYENYTLYVESAATDQNWFNEVLITMARTKPANMVFINKPLVYSSIGLSEEVSYEKLNWNYRAGYWALGQKPFSSIEYGGILKMANSNSLKPELLQAVADFTVRDIKEVVINGEFILQNFTTKTAENGECTIEYFIEANRFTAITSIGLLDANGNVLSSFAVYVPVLDDIIIKHIIKVKEA